MLLYLSAPLLTQDVLSAVTFHPHAPTEAPMRSFALAPIDLCGRACLQITHCPSKFTIFLPASDDPDFSSEMLTAQLLMHISFLSAPAAADRTDPLFSGPIRTAPLTDPAMAAFFAESRSFIRQEADGLRADYPDDMELLSTLIRAFNDDYALPSEGNAQPTTPFQRLHALLTAPAPVYTDSKIVDLEQYRQRKSRK